MSNLVWHRRVDITDASAQVARQSLRRNAAPLQNPISVSLKQAHVITRAWWQWRLQVAAIRMPHYAGVRPENRARPLSLEPLSTPRARQDGPKMHENAFQKYSKITSGALQGRFCRARRACARDQGDSTIGLALRSEDVRRTWAGERFRERNVHETSTGVRCKHSIDAVWDTL